MARLGEGAHAPAPTTTVGTRPADGGSAAGAASAIVPARAGRPVGLPVSRWEPQYQLGVIATDIVVIFAMALAGVALFPVDAVASHLAGAMAAITVATVIAGLAITRAWDPKVLGQGAEEFRRLGRGLVGATVALSLAALALDADVLRPWALLVAPAVLVVAAPARYGLRRVLHRRRRAGRCMLPVLAAGSVTEVADLIARTRREPFNGWQIEAACTPGGLGDDGTGEIDGVPVVGDLDDLAERVVQGGYRVVAVVPDHGWTRRRLQQLAWRLEDTPADVVVAPVLMEVTGPRLHVAPVFGLPLLRVSAPRFVGFRWVVKNVLDRCAAALLLLVTAPLLLALAIGIKSHDRGPVFYRQTRVGRDGRTFSMVKFRSMVTNADTLRAGLVATSNEGAGPLFKMRSDPRITPIGSVLRRYSLDELPQLFNVIGGSMSLVGPRPPLPEEVAAYAPDVFRRLKVKPGLTGLWQVSGRSDLSWTESVRLDLRYVEDWSLALDLTILWKTFGAVRRGEGAY